MRVRCGTGKFETDKPSNRNLKRKPWGRGRKSDRKAEGVEVATVRRGGGRRKEAQEAEYRNQKEGMETGLTEEESKGDARNRSAPREPLPGEIGKRGKERAEG